MADPFLIVCGAVAAVFLVLITASMFGVSRRAVEAEMRRADDHDHDAGGHGRERRDDLAA
jgi:hypothetical protein